MTALELLLTLHDAGVHLVPFVDRVQISAPRGALTPALKAAIQGQRQALLDLVEAFEERAALAEYCAGLPRAEAEDLAWQFLADEVSCVE